MAERPQPLWTTTVKAGGKVYFLDIFPGREGRPYLSICDNKKDAATGQYTRVRIFANAEAARGLAEGLAEAAAWFGANASQEMEPQPPADQPAPSQETPRQPQRRTSWR